MSKTQHSEIKITLLGAAAGVLFTAIYDWIKEKPILSSFKSIIIWFWNNILEYNFTVWQIIIGMIILLIIKTILKKNITVNEKADWLEYTQDIFSGIKWKWEWRNNGYNLYSIKNLQPVCNSCGTGMTVYEDWHENTANCPRCDNHLSKVKDLSKIKAIINDNIEREIYKKNYL